MIFRMNNIQGTQSIEYDKQTRFTSWRESTGNSPGIENSHKRNINNRD